MTANVDDLLVTCVDIEPIRELLEGLLKRYGEIRSVDGPTVNCLGTVFDTTQPGEAKIAMEGFVDDPMKFHGGEGISRCPAGPDLFEWKENDRVSAEAERKLFNSTVAKLLYLGKRTRLDVLTVVSYLATRVQKCVSGDLAKLDKVMRYLRGTADKGCVFRPGGEGVRQRGVRGAQGRKVAHRQLRGARRRWSCALHIGVAEDCNQVFH